METFFKWLQMIFSPAIIVFFVMVVSLPGKAFESALDVQSEQAKEDLAKQSALSDEGSNLERRAYTTRAASHAKRHYRAEIVEACYLQGAERSNHVARIADEFADTDGQRIVMIESIKRRIDRGFICQQLNHRER